MSGEVRTAPAHLETMCEVDSIRMWLWYELYRRGWGFLAHLAINTGFRAVECLRTVDVEFALLGYPRGKTVGDYLAPWAGAVQACADKLDTLGMGDKHVARLRSHCGRVLAMIVVAQRKPLPNELTAIEPGSCLAPKDEPCASAPAPVVASESPPVTSPAADTGSPSPTPSSGRCGTATTTTRRTGSICSPSDEDNGPSSPKRHKKGAGHPKRPGPYHKKRGKT